MFAHKSQIRFRTARWLKCTGVLLVVILNLLLGVGLSHAQDGGPIQVFSEQLGPEDIFFYTLSDLKEGETLYVYVKGIAGNLDPLVALIDGRMDPGTLREQFIDDLDRGILDGHDPYEVLHETADRLFLIWDDDSGAGYDAALEYSIPADGDYLLAATTSLGNSTFGAYRLMIGLNAPEVLTGEAYPRGDTIAVFDKEASRKSVAVQETTGTLTVDKPSTFHALVDLHPGDTFYAFVEATAGDLRPTLRLRDFGNKTIRTGNLLGRDPVATLQYSSEDVASGYFLDVAGWEDGGESTTGDYRLLVGVNSPQVLTGQAESAGQLILRQPIEVQVGIELDQITDVDQKAENDECQCNFRVFPANDFLDFVTEKDARWPAVTLANQQGNRWSQNQLVVLYPSGEASYFERFSTTFQAPDFDFRDFPFDTQQFYMRVDSLYPEEFYVYTDSQELSGLGEQLGEEEWYITESDTAISSQKFGSQFSFHFEMKRHLSYYILRVIIPIILIIIVGWVTFFLRDYSKRVDIASANLLVFVMFNFTISDNLPKLGYLTLLDTLLICTFVIGAMVVVFNVALKRLEITDRQSLAYRIDKYTIWIYPLIYFLGFYLVWIFVV